MNYTKLAVCAIKHNSVSLFNPSETTGCLSKKLPIKRDSPPARSKLQNRIHVVMMTSQININFLFILLVNF